MLIYVEYTQFPRAMNVKEEKGFVKNCFLFLYPELLANVYSVYVQ